MLPLTIPVVFAISFAVSLGGAVVAFRVTHNYKATAIVFGSVFPIQRGLWDGANARVARRLGGGGLRSRKVCFGHASRMNKWTYFI